MALTDWMAQFLIAFIVFGIILYVYTALVLMAIAKKLNVPNGWLAWIPIANIYLMTQLAGLPGLWTLIILVSFIPFVGGLALMVVLIWWYWRICEKLGKPGWWAILTMIPIVNFVIMGILAWGQTSAPAMSSSKPKKK